jgi:hypothetical protein
MITKTLVLASAVILFAASCTQDRSTVTSTETTATATEVVPTPVPVPVPVYTPAPTPTVAPASKGATDTGSTKVPEE